MRDAADVSACAAPQRCCVAAPAPALDAGWLRELARRCGAEAVGLASAEDPALADQSAAAQAAMFGTRTFVSLGVRLHRENARSPLRSLYNLEQRRCAEALVAAARALAAELERSGVRAVHLPPAFPMEFGPRMSGPGAVAHRVVAEAAGLGRTGLNRLLIHPVHGSCLLLTTVLVDRAASAYDRPLLANPCFGCGLCAAACPTGAIAADGHFNALACLVHNYRPGLSGFRDWVRAVVGARSVREYRAKFSDVETLELWQGLTHEAGSRCGYCVSVCPAGSMARPDYDADRGQYQARVVAPLGGKREPVYAVSGSDADGYAERHFPAKTTRLAGSGMHFDSVAAACCRSPSSAGGPRASRPPTTSSSPAASLWPTP